MLMLVLVAPAVPPRLLLLFLLLVALTACGSTVQRFPILLGSMIPDRADAGEQANLGTPPVPPQWTKAFAFAEAATAAAALCLARPPHHRLSAHRVRISNPQRPFLRSHFEAPLMSATLSRTPDDVDGGAQRDCASRPVRGQPVPHLSGVHHVVCLTPDRDAVVVIRVQLGTPCDNEQPGLTSLP